MLGQLRVIPEWLYYFGGLADKVEGRVIPLDRAERPQLHAARAGRASSAMIIPWNSPVLLHDVHARRRRSPPATPSSSSPPSTRPRASSRRCALAEQVGLPARRAQRRHRRRRGGRRARRRIPDVAKIVVHRQRRDGQRIAARAAGRLAARHAGARRQERQHRLRRRRPRGRRGRHPRRHLRGRRADLRRRLARRSSSGQIYDELLARVAPRAPTRSASATRWHEATQMGPIANAPQLERVDGDGRARRAPTARRSSAAGSPGRVDGLPDGLFYEPTILERRRQRRAASRRRRSSGRCSR